MTALRLVPLPIHAALELLVGLALMALPFVLGVSTAGIAVGVIVGALTFGLALQAVETGRTGSVAAHHAADYGVALGLAGAAVVLATVDAAAALLFGAV